MTIFPLIKGQVELKTTKKNFISKIKKLTEKEYPLIRPTYVSEDENLKEYARELYDDSFILWKIPSPGFQPTPFLFTIIHGRIIEKGDCITLKYFIRFNIWSNILIIGICIATFYLLYDNIFLSNHFDLMSWLIILISYLFFIFIFREGALKDKVFVEKLMNETFA